MTSRKPQSAASDAPLLLIDPGLAAPALKVQDQHGRAHDLKTYRGRWVVLYFYPKDATPGCTTEACAFRDVYEELAAQGAVVLGVSPDDAASHERFGRKHDLPFSLLADTDQRVCRAYGVWQSKTLYGRQFMGVVRTTYLIDPAGRVARRWDRVRVAGHERQVLDALRELAGRSTE
jgi:peroxiredoxin Q/BCP